MTQIFNFSSDAQEAEALSYQTQINDIFTNSWGPYDDGHRYEGPGPVLKAAIKQSIYQGRGGKGTIYVWASGNGRMYNDNCNYDGYASNKYTIAIGALSDFGNYPFYRFIFSFFFPQFFLIFTFFFY